MSKVLMIAAAVFVISMGTASAADEPRPLPKYFDDPMPSSANDRINWALRARGEPPLGMSRVIHDNGAVVYIPPSPK